MKVSSHVELIQTSFSGRPLNLPVIRGTTAALVDTGLVGTPALAIFPHLRSVGLSAEDISVVLITHAHADHFGGNEELRANAGQSLRFAAHIKDQEWIENPPLATRQSYGHYVDLGLMSATDLEKSISASGNGVTLNVVLTGGEVFHLGDGAIAEVFFAPGHTFGNICLLERSSGVLIQGETVCGVGQYNTEGALLTVPFYEDIVTYLGSIASVARLSFDTLLSSHLPLMDRGQAARFFADSMDFALHMEAEIVRRLCESAKPVTALDMWHDMDKLWGIYPRDLGLYMLLESHLAGLVKRGKAEGSPLKGMRWLGPGGDDLSALADTARGAIRAM